MATEDPVNMRSPRRGPSRSGATLRTETRADAAAAPTPAPPKVGAARLARLGAADLPWLGEGGGAMLAGYDGPEVSGPDRYPAGPRARR